MGRPKSDKTPPRKPMDPTREAITRRAKSILDAFIPVRDFERKTGKHYSTIQHWIDVNKNGLPETSLNEFLNCLKVCGIECSHEWMMYGKGAAPKKIDAITRIAGDEVSQRRLKKNRTDEVQTHRIAEELNAFLQWDREAVSYVVPDDAMEPRFINGEIVAGIRRYGIELEKLIGQDCIVLIENHGEFCLRTLRKGNLPGRFHLAPTNSDTHVTQAFIPDVKVVSAAPVIWTRRKDRF